VTRSVTPGDALAHMPAYQGGATQIAGGTFELAQSLAIQTPAFEESRGPGKHAGHGITIEVKDLA